MHNPMIHIHIKFGFRQRTIINLEPYAKKARNHQILIVVKLNHKKQVNLLTNLHSENPHHSGLSWMVYLFSR